MGVRSCFLVPNSGFSSYVFVCLCLSYRFCVRHAEHLPENDVGPPSENASQTAPVEPGEITVFPLIFSTQVQQTLLENGEWKLYRDSVALSTLQFDVLQWWEGMAVRLPSIYRIARSIVAIPHTSCAVERSFSVWKRIGSNKQQSTAEGTHKAYVSFCFNGVVPPP